MSKMSQLHADLTEQAAQLGFHSIEEAEVNGYEVDYEKGILIEGREKAHNAWLEEKNSLLKDLTRLQEILETLADGEKHEISSYWADTIWHAIDFIEKGEI